jgi:hypothetical protein
MALGRRVSGPGWTDAFEIATTLLERFLIFFLIFYTWKNVIAKFKSISPERSAGDREYFPATQSSCPSMASFRALISEIRFTCEAAATQSG